MNRSYISFNYCTLYFFLGDQAVLHNSWKTIFPSSKETHLLPDKVYIPHVTDLTMIEEAATPFLLLYILPWSDVTLSGDTAVIFTGVHSARDCAWYWYQTWLMYILHAHWHLPFDSRESPLSVREVVQWYFPREYIIGRVFHTALRLAKVLNLLGLWKTKMLIRKGFRREERQFTACFGSDFFSDN